MFDEFDLDGLRLPSRIVMAPMTRSRVGPGDAPTQLNAEYYAQRASSGLIISEAIVVEPRGRGYLYTPGIYSRAQIEGWKRVTDAVHAAGGRIFAQLWHVGRVSHSSLLPGGAAPLGPTNELVTELFTFACREGGEPGPVRVSRPTAMSLLQIEATIEQFATAAHNARKAGFDGVEILAANGYLFDQFQNSKVNTRDDRFGSRSAVSRACLLLETLDAIRRRAGKIRIGVRLSPFGRFNCMPDDDHADETYLHIAD
jgi:N-ethylmaleimide reductase